MPALYSCGPRTSQVVWPQAVLSGAWQEPPPQSIVGRPANWLVKSRADVARGHVRLVESCEVRSVSVTGSVYQSISLIGVTKESIEDKRLHQLHKVRGGRGDAELR